VTKVQQKELVY